MADEVKDIEKALDDIRKLLKPGETIKVNITLKSEKKPKANRE